jgi:hypothetical protein
MGRGHDFTLHAASFVPRDTHRLAHGEPADDGYCAHKSARFTLPCKLALDLLDPASLEDSEISHA